MGCVEREEEMGCLRNQARIRKSLLVFGPEGVGKSRLLRRLSSKLQTLALREPASSRRANLILALFLALRSADKGVRPASNFTLYPLLSEGYCARALDARPFLMVLDHLDAPSRVVTGMIKDLHYYGRTPVIFASRSPHMEDIGALGPLCTNKSERLELKNWPHSIALEFARRNAASCQLWASNLEMVLPSFVEWSDGNPGSILTMLKMARLPQYRMDDQIKAHILYVDYRMGRRS